MALQKSGLTSRDAWSNYQTAHQEWHAAKNKNADYNTLKAIGERVERCWQEYSRIFCREHRDQIALLVIGKPRRPA